MASVGFFLGSLVPSFLPSRLGFWLTRQWVGGAATRVLTVHAICLLLVAFIGGVGMADGGAFTGLQALAAYAPAQVLWLIVDLVRLSNSATVTATPPPQPLPPDENDQSGVNALWFVIAIALAAILVLVAAQWSENQNAQPWENSWELSPSP